MNEGYTPWKRFCTWMGLAGLVFGAFCGGATASGTYATTHFAKFGGGYMLVFVGFYILIMSLSCILGLNVVKAYGITDYRMFYLALYGLQGPDANPWLKKVVTVVFDCYTILKGITAVAGSLALMGILGNSMLGWNAQVSAFLSSLLFALLCVTGGGFLRRFNTAITIALLVSLLAIMVSVCRVKGSELMGLLGNFQVGLDWSGVSLRVGFAGVIAYCFNVGSWGATLSSYAERVQDGKDVIGGGITIGVVVSSLFFITSCIVLPYLPQELNSTPILNIIGYLGSQVLLVIYWMVLLLSAVSTGPAFGFSITARFEKLWTNPAVSLPMKRLVISLIYMVLCWFISNIGLTNIVLIILGATGTASAFIIWIPLFISIPRVSRLRRAQRAAA